MIGGVWWAFSIVCLPTFKMYFYNNDRPIHSYLGVECGRGCGVGCQSGLAGVWACCGRGLVMVGGVWWVLPLVRWPTFKMEFYNNFRPITFTFIGSHRIIFDSAVDLT